MTNCTFDSGKTSEISFVASKFSQSSISDSYLYSSDTGILLDQVSAKYRFICNETRGDRRETERDREVMVVCLLILLFQAVDSVISGNQIYSPSILIDMLYHIISYHNLD